LELDFTQGVKVNRFDFDLSTLLGNAAAWGNQGGRVVIGDGQQANSYAVGSAAGTTTVLGHTVDLRGSQVAAGGYAQIGFATALGTNPSGAIDVRAKEGGV